MIYAKETYFWFYEFKAFNQSAVLCTRQSAYLHEDSQL